MIKGLQNAISRADNLLRFLSKSLLSISIIFLLFFISNARNNGFEFNIIPTQKKDKTPEILAHQEENTTASIYYADMPYGLIGTSEEQPVDQVIDNIFHIQLPSAPSQNVLAYLSYELNGVANHNAVSRSINNSQAIGAHVVKLGMGWTHQTEVIPLSLLHAGDNVIRFTIPVDANYHYEVRNVNIQFIDHKNDVPAIILNQPDSIYFDRLAYLKGVLHLPSVSSEELDQVILKCGEQAIPIHHGEFEFLLPNPEQKSINATLEATLPDGRKIKKAFVFNQWEIADRINVQEEKGGQAHGLFLPMDGLELSYDNNEFSTSIQVPAEALEKECLISINALRAIDLPVLNTDLVNVTAGASGYRFLPHGITFGRDAQIKIPFDENLIPEGYASSDIRTYYFDDKAKSWLALELDTISSEEGVAISKSRHFTDIINGVIKVPESPKTQGYTPTYIKDFRSASPADQIMRIQPPVANSRGNANLNFDLKLPSGRRGMEPSLSLDYSNAGDNGWLGLGWDLTVPHINIDTRWGVPRYDAQLESETYLIDGEQLAPVANRTALVARTAEKVFYPRVQNHFDRIIRHGSHPSNYWWEVTNKSGVKYYYGGLPEQGIINTAVLKDDRGNIAYWALTQVRDLDENTQNYEYATVSDPGTIGSNYNGRQLYLDKIYYTGTLSEKGPYSIEFTRDRQLQEQRRQDVMIDARNGFKMVTADLLRKIDVKLNDQLIRTYALNYKAGAFYKTLLESVDELDDTGAVFYSHSFDYYDDVNNNSGFEPFAERTPWTIGDDGIDGGIVNPIPGFSGQSSALSTEKSNSIGGGLAVTFGFIYDGWSKWGTVGGSFEFDNTTNEGLVAMLDINGDDLPDKVVKKNNGLSYRPNLGKDNSFGELKSIVGVNNFSASNAQTFSGGLQIIPGGFAFFGYNRATTNVNTSTYFSDFNGDQLMDIAANGLVYFNHIDAGGNSIFEPNSTRTPNPLTLGGSVDKRFLAPDTALQRRKEEQFPLQDIFRFWTAPFDGTINISAPVQLMQAPEERRSKKEDGVRVSIQVIDQMKWSARIPAGDFSVKTPTGLGGLAVKKGDRIYFRVQSIYNGENDEVFWDPIITYTNGLSPIVDANNRNTNRYQASQDFVVSGSQNLGIPIDGVIKIFGSFEKKITSDDVSIIISRSDTSSAPPIEIFRREFSANATHTGPLDLIELAVKKGDFLSFQLYADSYIDRTALEWFPNYKIDLPGTYTQEDSLTMVALDRNNIIVPLNMGFNSWPIPTPTFEVKDTGQVTILPFLIGNADTSGIINFTIKGINQLYAKQQVLQQEGSALTNPDSLVMDLPMGQLLFPEFHVRDQKLAQGIQNVGFYTKRVVSVMERDTSVKDSVVLITVQKQVLDTFPAGLYTNATVEELQPVFRGWGQFSFAGDKGDGPFDEAQLNLKRLENEVDYRQILRDTASYNEDMDNISKIESPTNVDFGPLFGNGFKKTLEGKDTAVFVAAQTMSSSRLFMHDVSVDSLMVTAGASLSAVTKITKTDINSIAAGAVLIGGYSDASTTNMLDMMDLNGDSYPDILHIDDIQYTFPNGGLEQQGRLNVVGMANSYGQTLGLSLGGKFPRASATNPRNSKAPNAQNTRTKAGSRNEHHTSNSSIGIVGSIGVSDNNSGANSSWIDINGDGLVDKVYVGGDVALNLGYSFAPREKWNFNHIDISNNLSVNGGIGVNINQGTLEAGFGLSRTEGSVDTMFMDINGDGLPDILSGNNDAISVQLNSGSRFEAPVLWKGSNIVNKTLSTGESVNVAFTIPINIIFFKICINPSFNLGQGVSSQMDQIMDMNGDAYPDLLYSDDDGKLEVNTSNIGRTNMLRQVNCPLGANFSMDYNRVGNTYDQPSSIWTLSNLEVFDGFSGDGADTMRTQFVYENGFYNRREREFYGFETVITHELNTLDNDAVYRSKEELYFHKNYYQKGLLQRTASKDANGNIFNEVINTYELRNLQDSVAFPALVRTDYLTYEGEPNPGASTYQTFKYDAIGNLIEIQDIGNGAPEDRLVANIKYHDLEESYLKDIPSEIVVTTEEGVKRKRTTSIDDRGNILEIKQFLTEGTSANYNMEYDDFGNLIKMIRPANYKGERFFYSYEYDEVIHSYITKTSDAFGYSVQTEYEYRFGNVIRSISMHDEEVRFQIDNRGRIQSLTGPYELDAGKPYTIAFEYFPEADVPYAITHHYDPEYDDDIDIITFIDGLDRTLQTKKLGSLFQGREQEDELVMIISGHIIYDAFGRIVETYYPSTEPFGTSNNQIATILGKPRQKSSYDILDRPLTKELADGAISGMAYIAANNLKVTQITDPLGNQVERYEDVRNRQVVFRQLSGPDGIISTKYFYNALSELIRVEDTENNPILSTYDNLGRRTSILHPDAGLTEFTFDLSNNLIQKVTPNIRTVVPNGGAIQYDYEYERLIGIDYPIQYQNKVSYEYGAPNTGNQTGRITLIKDASGGREFFYGKLGEVLKEIRTVLLSSVFYTTYVSEQEYDTWNRVKKMTYPDGEELVYTYNRGGSLNSIRGRKLGNDYSYVEKLGYDEFEERVYMQYGNGTEMHYEFNPQRRWLDRLQAVKKNGDYMMNNRYTRDLISNVTNIVNNITAQADQLGGYADHRYQYDNLYRLSGATGLYEGINDTLTYGLEMKYDNLFNIVNKKLSRNTPSDTTYNYTYNYAGAGPHQATQIGEKRRSYDPNGNLINYGNHEYFWDEENRLQGVIQDGTIHKYTYDAAGERVIKSSGGVQGTWLNGAPAGTIEHEDNYTVYVSPFLVARRTNYTKHIYVGSERIATKIGDGQFTNISFPQSGLTAGGIDYIARSQQLKEERINYYASLGVSPGPPTNKLFYAEPQNTGIAAPVLVDNTAAEPPPGWPGNTTPPTSGPPIFVEPIPSNAAVKAGYGFSGTGHIYEANQYFYHGDHLGNTAYTSNVLGEAAQHVEYMAFGETLFEEHNSSYQTPYLYNAKELDRETGLYYYGARYYDAASSIWLSVDPLWELPAEIDKSPYAYVRNNPVNYIDPDGRAAGKPRGLRKSPRRSDRLYRKKRKERWELPPPGSKRIRRGVKRYGKGDGIFYPGPYAAKFIKAPNKKQSFSKKIHDEIDKIFYASGCHRCGTKVLPPGKSAVPDHQPVSSLVGPNAKQRLYPHCPTCSSKQGGAAAKALKANKNPYSSSMQQKGYNN